MEQIYRIDVDHGYGNIKTAHHIFQSGVVQKESITELSGMTVEYEGEVLRNQLHSQGVPDGQGMG